MHVHAGDSKLTEAGSANFFVNSDGSTAVQSKGIPTEWEISKIQAFIKINYFEMYDKRSSGSKNGFYNQH